MLERRRSSKSLPIVFLFLQIIALFLLSYFVYFLLRGVGVSSVLLLVVIVIIDIFVIIRFMTRYFEIRNRTRYMDYEHLGEKH